MAKQEGGWRPAKPTVTALTLPDPEHDRPSRRVIGRLIKRDIPTLDYTQYLVDGEHVDPATVEPVAQDNPHPPRDDRGA